MADQPSRINRESEPISLQQGYEVRHWCKVLGCTEDELRAAVKAVGTSAERVREFLRRPRS
jgi:hypothetical protein